MSNKGETRVEFPKEGAPPVHRPVIINLWAACGVGKTSTMHGIMSYLKFLGKNAEVAPEAAKPLHYEKRWDAMRDQVFLEGLQSRIEGRLIGNADIIITDAPAGIGAIYAATQEQRQMVLDTAQIRRARFRCFDVRLLRDASRPYREWGREQNLAESMELDQLLDHYIARTIVAMDLKVVASLGSCVEIADTVLRRMGNGTL